MQTIELNNRNGVNYKIQIEIGSNLRKMVSVFRESEKCPLVGTSFDIKETDYIILQWAKRALDKMDEDKTKTLEEYLS